MKQIRILSIFFILVSSGLKAESFEQLQFQHYSTEHGLPVGTVWKVYQDSCGFIWFGTENGLTFFDGIQFKTFSTTGEKGTTITGNKVYDIIQGHNKLLYIATDNGITIFNKITGKFNPLILSDNAQTNQQQPIRTILIESDSIILIGALANGIIKINVETNHKSIIEIDSKTIDIRSLDQLEDKCFISTYGNGFYIKQPDNTISHHVISVKGNDPTEFEGKNRINQIIHKSGNLYWLATERGLFEFNCKTKGISEISLSAYMNIQPRAPQIRKILKDKNGNIWIASFAGLLFLRDGEIANGHLFESNEENIFSLPSNRLLDTFEDAGGSIWVSNYDVGVSVLHGIEVKYHYIKKRDKPNSLPGKIVTAFEKYDKNRILVGTEEGISLFNSKTARLINYNEIHNKLNKRILSIYNDKNGNLWIGSWGGGLQKFNPNTGKIKTFQRNNSEQFSINNNTVICIQPDGKEHLWIGTFSGLNRLNINTEKFESCDSLLGIGKTAIYAIYKDNDQSLWIGTNGKGLLEFNPNTKKVTRYLANENDTLSIISNTIHSITKDSRGNLWIATELGASIFNPNTKTFSTIDENTGLPNNIIWGIIEDKESNFWMSGNKGIYRYNAKLNKYNPEAYKNYDKKDGLRSLEFSQGASFYDKENNQIYFGGTQGFYFYNPTLIKPRTFEPIVQITSIKVMDNDYISDTSASFLKKLILPYNKNFLAFEFTSLDFIDPSNNLYQFKVSGQSDKWSQPSTRNYVSFPDLKEGEYTLHIRGTNSEGYWSNNDRVIHIVITPPWFRTNIAYVSYVLFILIAIIAFVQWRTYQLGKEKRVLEAIVDERTRELQQKNADITASIQYAKRIQQAIIFPKITAFLREFPDSFVMFKPKDIVSGDFFWYAKKGKRRYFAAADCTGHGVPGAFMSIIGNNLLEKAITEYDITDPHEILTQLDEDVKRSLNQQGRKDDTFDGMDIALCVIDEGRNELFYSGAYRPLFLIRNGEIIQTKASRCSIGGSQIKKIKEFKTFTTTIEKGDTFYIFSDGITDQFGGPQNKKFSTSKLKSTLLEISNQTMFEQEIHMEQLMENWLEGYEQIDDIILVGIRFNSI